MQGILLDQSKTVLNLSTNQNAEIFDQSKCFKSLDQSEYIIILVNQNV